MAFMELTFLKLAGSQERGEGGHDGGTGTRRTGKKEAEEERGGREGGWERERETEKQKR